MSEPHAVVAGFDGSADSRIAVEYAARAAADLGLPLRVVHCYAWSQAETAVFHAAAHLIAALCEDLEPHYPTLSIHPIIVSRSPAAALIGESRSAAMVVVGRQGTGTYGGCHTGLVSRQVATQAVCPVVVTPAVRASIARSHANGPVMISLDQEQDPVTTDFAFVEAARREVALYAIRMAGGSNQMPARSGGSAPDQVPPESAETGGQIPDSVPDHLNQWIDQELDVPLDLWRKRYPQVEVHGAWLNRDLALPALLPVTQEVGLLVVGAASSDNTLPARLDRLAVGLLSSAYCPVAVVEKPVGL
jgi:nucleotide-binding universal stress UspA family protein